MSTRWIGGSSVFARRQTSMPEGRRAGLRVAAILGVAAVASLAWGVIAGRHLVKARVASVVFNERTPFPVLAEGLRQGDARELVILFPRMAAQAGPVPKPTTEAEAK